MVFGAFEGIYNFLIRMVGLRTDTADAAGSLHAKVADTKSYLVNTINAKLGTSTDGRASNTIFGFASTQVKSIQRGLTTAGSTTNVTISAVNTAKAFVVANGKASSAGATGGGGITARLTSSTNLELGSGFYDANGATVSAVISWEVIELY